MSTVTKFMRSLWGKDDADQKHPASATPSPSDRQPTTNAVAHIKTDEQRETILQVLYENAAFAEISNQQRNELVDHFVLTEIAPGEVLFKQGDYGRYFYIVEDGQCEVYVQKLDHPPKRVATVHVGATFGELALMYPGPRRATVKATKPTKLWALDRDSFTVGQGNVGIKDLFDKHSTEVGGQRYMTMDGFISSFMKSRETTVPGTDISEEKERLRILFRMVDRDHSGMITFADYAMFYGILANPDPEYEIAFRYFDRRTRGRVSKKDFMETMLARATGEDADNAFIDYFCDVVTRFFGPPGHERSLSFPVFAEFFIMFQIEHAQQLFLLHDPERTGQISENDFMSVVPRMGDVRAPLYARQFLDICRQPGYVSYAEFVAFQNFLHHLPALERVLRATFKKFPQANINKNTFRALVRTHAVTTFSPLEASICFRVFGTQRYTVITGDSFRRYSAIWPSAEHDDQKERRAAARLGADIDEVLLGPTQSAEAQQRANQEIVVNMAMGWLAAGVGAFAVFPMDAVKTRMQNSRARPIVQGRYVYKNSFDCLRHIIQHQGGVRALYRGVGVPMMGVGFEKMLKLSANDYLRNMFEIKNTTKGDLHFPLEVLAGAGAGACQVALTNPIEMLKIRMQLQSEPLPWMGGKPVPPEPTRRVFAIARELGLSGLYQGLGACLLRDMFFSAIYFPIYASLKTMLTDQTTGLLSSSGLLLAGALATVPAALVTTPLDVIKTRLQAPRPTTSDWRINRELKYRSIADCFIKIRRNEGYRAFWKGSVARVCLWSPQFAVSLFAYEYLQKKLFPDITPMPLTYIPIDSRDLVSLRTEKLTETLKTVDKELHILDLDQPHTPPARQGTEQVQTNVMEAMTSPTVTVPIVPTTPVLPSPGVVPGAGLGVGGGNGGGGGVERRDS